MNQTKTYKFLATLGFVFSFLVVAQAVSALSWEPPTASAPANNTSAPIWVGGESQRKSGPLQIDGWFTSAGNTYLSAAGGNVGIGTLSPDVNSKLEVDGQIYTKRPLTQAINVPVTNSAGSMLKLYDYDSNANWAGIGVFTNGLPWIRNGLDILNSSGRTMVRVPPTGGIAIGGDGTGDSAAINYGSYTLSLGTFGGKDVNISSHRVMVGTTDASSGATPDPLHVTRLKVNGSVGADYYCDQDGNNCKSITQLGGGGGGGSTGVSKIVAGAGVSVTPAAGTGDVTIANTRTVTCRSVDTGWQDGPEGQTGADFYASCPAGTTGSTVFLTGGGGECGNTNAGYDSVLTKSLPNDNTQWQLSCSGELPTVNYPTRNIGKIRGHIFVKCCYYQ